MYNLQVTRTYNTLCTCICYAILQQQICNNSSGKCRESVCFIAAGFVCHMMSPRAEQSQVSGVVCVQHWEILVFSLLLLNFMLFEYRICAFVAIQFMQQSKGGNICTRTHRQSIVHT
ncbi:unnamed protein product [Ceratitis capitata]|uniref:(Mediterranean fruit fly) hypothetical protein n=1 Tax=Ceratitis capitata TaxID=7213 RepID=A0A811V627_CERCA|nr:unnamed protein product [Ceratitis capitata]